MKRSKEYRKLFKKYKKLITKSAKDSSKCPWDWSFGLDPFVQFLQFMRDYYTLGENVWQVDESRTKIVDSLNKTLEEYDAWQNCEDKYTKVLFKCDENYEKELKHWLRLGYHLQAPIENSKDKYTIYSRDTFLTLLEDYKENLKEMVKEYTKHRKNFFKLIADNIESWWD